MTTQLIAPFNARAYAPASVDGAGSYFPVGNHPVVITAGEVKPTKNQDGGLVEFTVEAIDGPSKGSSMKYRINLYNSSQQAKSIAERQMSALCHVVAVYDITDLSMLFGKPFVVKVESQNDPAYPNSTQIKGVMDMAGNDPGKAGAGPAPAAPPAAFAPPVAAAPAGWSPPGAVPAAAPASPAPAPAWGGAAAVAPAAPAWGPAAAPAAGATPPWQK